MLIETGAVGPVTQMALVGAGAGVLVEHRAAGPPEQAARLVRESCVCRLGFAVASERLDDGLERLDQRVGVDGWTRRWTRGPSAGPTGMGCVRLHAPVKHRRGGVNTAKQPLERVKPGSRWRAVGSLV